MDYQSLVERKLEPVGHMGDDIVYRCPHCEGDAGSGHLYINYKSGKYNCFKCDLGGKHIGNLLKILGIDNNFDYDRLYNEQSKELDSILSMKSPKKIDIKVLDYSTDLDILTEYYLAHTKPLSIEGYNYLRNRGISDYSIERLLIREGVNRYSESLNIRGVTLKGRDYSGRIMIPSLRRDGRLSFYVARDYIGDKPAKYMNPPKELAVASEDVWNLDMVTSNSVIICEGVLTAIAASPANSNAVATYGKSIAEHSSNDDARIRVTSQGEKLLARKFDNYYVVYDADAHKEGIKTCQYLYDRGANVYLVLIDPEKYGKKADVLDIGYSEFSKLMKEAIHYRGELSII